MTITANDEDACGGFDQVACDGFELVDSEYSLDLRNRALEEADAAVGAAFDCLGAGVQGSSEGEFPGTYFIGGV